MTSESVIESVLSSAGSTGGSDSAASHVGRVVFEIVPPEERTLDITSRELVDQWREEIGTVTGAERPDLPRRDRRRGGARSTSSSPGGDFDELREGPPPSSGRGLGEYDGGQRRHRHLRGRASARSGSSSCPVPSSSSLTLSDVARQVRLAFLGSEVQTLQRAIGRRCGVVVRYPRRRARASLESASSG